MSTVPTTPPKDPTLVDIVTGLVDVTERLVERNHLLDQHRDEDGQRPTLARCPADPCHTWRPFSVMYTRWLARRMP